MKKRWLHTALCAALALLTVVQLAAGPLSAVLPTARLTAGAAASEKEITHMSPKPLDNITLNAYLIPLYDEETRREQFGYCRDAHIDVLSHVYPTNPWTAEAHTADWYKQTMREASEYGLKLQTREIRLQGENALKLSDAELQAIADEYKDIPGFGGFYVVDEPYNPTPYARVENALRDVCPDTLVNVNFLPRGAYPEGEYIRRLTDYGSLMRYTGTLSLDVYCFDPNGGVNEAALFGNYEDLRRAGLMTGNNTAVYVQSVGSSQHGYRRPDAGDLRYNMMAALAYGVKEIKFFCWGTPPSGEGEYTNAIIDRDGKPTDLYPAVCDINADVHRLGQYIAACDAVEVYHSRRNAGVYAVVPSDLFIRPAETANVIVTLMQERGGDDEYIMLVNKNYEKEQTFTCTLDGVGSLQIVDENGALKPLSVKNGSFTLTLAAGDAAVLKLPKGDFIKEKKSDTQDMAVDATVTASTSKSEDGFLYNIYDGKYDGTGARLELARGSSAWITFDLGEAKTVNRVDVYPMGKTDRCGVYYPKTLEISVSADGKNWTTVASGDDFDARIKKVPVFRFDDVTARYVRLDMTAARLCEIGDVCIYNDDGTIPADIDTLFKEIEVDLGENLALGKPVFDYSTTTDVPDWNCHHTYINDGNTDTLGWASELFVNDSPDTPEWITIDLLDVYSIGKVVLTPRGIFQGYNVFPEDYQIEVSVDGENFTVAARVEGDNNPQSQDIRTLEFDAVDARYVRLKGTKLTPSGTVNGGYCLEMNEMEVYAAKPEETETETETETPDTAPPETDPVESDPVDTVPPDTDAPDTDAPDTETLADTCPVSDEESESAPAAEDTGCGSVIGAAPALAACAVLGVLTCRRRKD